MAPVSSAQRSLSVELLPAFASVDPGEWRQALSRGDTNVVFLTREWQQAWWDSYGRGRLLIAAVRQHGELVALSPLFDQDGLLYFVGSGASDYLDFVGDVSSPGALDALLATAREQVDNFSGFCFCLVPNASRTGALLREAAERLGLDFVDEGDFPAPVLDFSVTGAADAAIRKKGLQQAERFFERNGGILLRDLRTSEEILPHLDEFFTQHVDRWQSTTSPSPFLEERHRNFYRVLVREASDAGWLRFTRLEWQNRAIATHFGFCHNRTYTYYKPTFLGELARYSPGHVLLRRLLLSAIEENAATFDFGLGDEPYKQRFATATRFVNTWGMYAPGRERVAK